MHQRREHIAKVCRQPVMAEGYRVHRRRPFLLAGKIRWCLIPKVGTTFVRHVASYIDTHSGEERPGAPPGAGSASTSDGSVSTFDGSVSTSDDSASTSGHDDSVSTAAHSPSVSTARPTVAVLRDPYERLVAGYLDKVLLRPSWFPDLGHKIMKLSGVLGPTSKWSDRCSMYATFPQFVKYFINSEKSGKARNTHFTPMSEQCDFCFKNFTFVSRLDTLYEDIDFIFRKSNVTLDLGSVDYSRDTKIKRVLDKEREFVDKCTDIFTAMKTMWYSYHARGIILDSIPLPFTQPQSKSVTSEQFSQVYDDAVRLSKPKIDSRKQKRKFLVQMYLEVPLLDRQTLVELLKKDFALSQHDPWPRDIFPELS